LFVCLLTAWTVGMAFFFSLSCNRLSTTRQVALSCDDLTLISTASPKKSMAWILCQVGQDCRSGRRTDPSNLPHVTQGHEHTRSRCQLIRGRGPRADCPLNPQLARLCDWSKQLGPVRIETKHFRPYVGSPCTKDREGRAKDTSSRGQAAAARTREFSLSFHLRRSAKIWSLISDMQVNEYFIFVLKPLKPGSGTLDFGSMLLTAARDMKVRFLALDICRRGSETGVDGRIALLWSLLGSTQPPSGLLAVEHSLSQARWLFPSLAGGVAERL
jgi:hypothetical protein